MQAIQLGHLRRPETACRVDVDGCIVGQAKDDAEFRCKIRKVILAISRSGIEAATKAARRTVVAEVARRQVVAVVVARVLRSQAGADYRPFREPVFELRVKRHVDSGNVVVVVLALGSRLAQEIGPFGRPVLGLAEIDVGKIEIQADNRRQPIRLLAGAG